MNIIKKLWKNKLTRIYTIAAGAIIFLILIVVVISLSTRSTTVNESTLTRAAKKYLEANEKLLPQNDYDSRTISLATLVASDYIDSETDGANCSSYVTVIKLDDNYYYTPYIKCNDDDDTTLLADILLDNVVEDGDGLYNYNNSYIFRGENPNNFVELNNSLWRIIGLDESNNIKLIYYDDYIEYECWDDRYNSEFDEQYGINDYSLSRMKDYLDSYLETLENNDDLVFIDDIKIRLAKFEQCTGKIDLEDGNTNTCSSTIDDQLVGLITAVDYVNASLDSSCTITNTINCQNYNFLNNSGWTISAYESRSSYVYYIDKNYGLKTSNAYISRAIYPTIALRSDVIYESGIGTESDPYIIK
ncbi:MAG TPA: hypothetical protein PLC53_01110 [Bacilli bacterium]|nr:hypothetical protein [Bacilli bacterium]